MTSRFYSPAFERRLSRLDTPAMYSLEVGHKEDQLVASNSMVLGWTEMSRVYALLSLTLERRQPAFLALVRFA